MPRTTSCADNASACVSTMEEALLEMGRSARRDDVRGVCRGLLSAESSETDAEGAAAVQVRGLEALLELLPAGGYDWNDTQRALLREGCSSRVHCPRSPGAPGTGYRRNPGQSIGASVSARSAGCRWRRRSSAGPGSGSPGRSRHQCLSLRPRSLAMAARSTRSATLHTGCDAPAA
eukprot:18341-Rhodomonas_salina.7